MTAGGVPTLFMIAGPNGAGKSTFYEHVLRGKVALPFINADAIQADELRDARPEAAYEAAKIAEQRRRALVAGGKSFITESVFSHPSKLDFIKHAKTAGFRIFLFHVSVDGPDLSVARVRDRVRQGGHDVPERKIRERYRRNGALIRAAALISDRVHVYDNSRLGLPPRQVLSMTNGTIDYVDEPIPAWTRDTYSEELRNAPRSNHPPP